MKRIYSLLLAVLLLATLSAGVSASADNEKTNILLYMIASDLESDYSAATENLNEMMAAAKNFDENINLVVYAGGTKQWHNDIFSGDENRCVKIGKDGAELLYREKVRDMTAPRTLSDFLYQTKKMLPTGRNILILWDHGGGVFGFGQDEQQEDNEPMGVAELALAVESSGVNFDIIGFDACMMATVEMANMLSRLECGRYMVASEEKEPLGGWDYETWLSALAENPQIDSLTLCKKIADSYISWCNIRVPGVKVTLSVVDLEQFYKTIPQELNGYAENMSTRFENGQYDISVVQKALFTCSALGDSSDMVDAIQLAAGTKGGSGKKLAQALQNCIVYNRRYPENLERNGLMIFIPIGTKSVNGVNIDDPETLRVLGVEDSYINWITCVRQYTSLANGGEKQERTIMDVLNGAKSEKKGQTINEFVESHRLDVSDCYMEMSEQGIPQLIMPEEKKELTLAIRHDMYAYKDGQAVDYGYYLFSLDDFPLEKSEYLKFLYSGWLHINDVLCPFYTEDRVELEPGKIATYGYTGMYYNDTPGVLYLRLICDLNEGITVEPLCFQELNPEEKENEPEAAENDGAAGKMKPLRTLEMDFDEGGDQLGRLIPVQEMDADKIVSVGGTLYPREEHKEIYRTIDGIKWGDVKSFEWKLSEECKEIRFDFQAIDMFLGVHLLEMR